MHLKQLQWKECRHCYIVVRVMHTNEFMRLIDYSGINAGILLHCCDEYYCHIQSLIVASILFDGKLMINNNAPLRLRYSLEAAQTLSNSCKRTAT